MKRIFLLAMIFLVLINCEDEINVYIVKEPGTITGQVLPLTENATVELYQGTMIDQITVDNNGYFIFKDVSPGTYRIIARATHYGSREISGIHVTDGEGYEVGVVTLSLLPYPLDYIYPYMGSNLVE